MRESASRGFYLSPVPPYGYRKVMVKDGEKTRPKLELHPEQSQVVTRIFGLAQEGKGLLEIAKVLNRDGIAGPKGKGWAKTTTAKILSSEVYTGTLIWGQHSKRDMEPVRVENAWPAVIDHDTFHLVQARLSQRAPNVVHPKRVASRYLLSGLARCGHCGKALVGQDAKSGQFSYYVCGSIQKKGAGACPSPRLSTRKFERQVVDKIKERILTVENLKRLVDIVNEEMDSQATEHRGNLDSILAELGQVDARLDRLYDAVETGTLSLADLAPRIQQLRQRREQLETSRIQTEQRLNDRRVELADSRTVARYVAELHDFLSRGDLAERKAFVRTFVKEVKVTGDQVMLTYTMPMAPRGDSEEEFPVLSIVHGGGPSCAEGKTPTAAAGTLSGGTGLA
jgi:hypothetical protein